MQREQHSLRWLAGPLVAVLIVVVFIVDLLSDWVVAAAVLYVVPVLLSLRFFPRRRVMAVTLVCVVLATLGTPFSHFGSLGAGMVNLAIGIAAIVTTSYLGLRMLALEAASHEARAHLLRVSRIGNLGELASSIAHEVNQPLAAIASSAGAGRRWLEQTPPDLAHARESLERIAREAAQAADVLAGIHRLVSRKAPVREWTALDPLVRECMSIARAELERQQIRSFVQITDDLPPLWCDRVQIQQIIVNLLLNAIESLAETPAAERCIQLYGERDGEWLSLTVSDTGAGLSKEAMQHLWEPFWTNKEGGVGLGLTISRTIAEAHGGLLHCPKQARSGAVFELRLPIGRGADR